MDDKGRLHMPNGFVGETFKETGILAELRAEPETNETANRAARRRAEALERKLRELSD